MATHHTSYVVYCVYFFCTTPFCIVGSYESNYRGPGIYRVKGSVPILILKLYHREERGRKGMECKFPKIAHKTFDTINSWPPVHDCVPNYGVDSFACRKVVFPRRALQVRTQVWSHSAGSSTHILIFHSRPLPRPFFFTRHIPIDVSRKRL